MKCVWCDRKRLVILPVENILLTRGPIKSHILINKQRSGLEVIPFQSIKDHQWSHSTQERKVRGGKKVEAPEAFVSYKTCQCNCFGFFFIVLPNLAMITENTCLVLISPSVWHKGRICQEPEAAVYSGSFASCISLSLAFRLIVI